MTLNLYCLHQFKTDHYKSIIKKAFLFLIHLFKGIRFAIAPLQTGHMLCFDFFMLSPQSLHTHIWPHGIIIQFAVSDKQIVHSSAFSSA